MKVTGVTITPIAVKDAPLLNSVGVHEPYQLRSVIEVHTDAGLTGISEAQLARKLARPPAGRSRSKAETSKLLRRLFPDSPLSMRLAGLAALVRR